MNVWTIVLAIALLAAVYVVLPVGTATLTHYRRARRLLCPMNGRGALVQVNAAAAAVAEVIGRRKFNVRDCSRWPRVWGCRQQCVGGHARATAGAAPACPTSRTILVPLDGTPEGDSILPRVAYLAREEHADVRLMRVARQPTAVVSGNRVVSFTDQEIARVELEEAAYLNAAGERLPGVRVSHTVRFGEPVEKIVDEAEASGAGLIVMATRPRTLADRVGRRNIPEAVAHATRIPVIRMPSKGVSRTIGAPTPSL